MNLNYNLEEVKIIEFGVGLEYNNDKKFFAVPIDKKVQEALLEMVESTFKAFKAEDDKNPAKYEPSEKYASTEYLYYPLNDDLVKFISDIHNAANLDVNTEILENLMDIFCYFARIIDNNNRRLTAIRRATQFKGVLKSKNRLVRIIDNTLNIIEDNVFKLDNDFDFLVYNDTIFILRPSSFEFIADLKEAILKSVSKNIEKISNDLKFINFDVIEKYAQNHPRAARYLASICAQEETKNIDKELLKEACKQFQVEVPETNGKLHINDDQVMQFLEVLDRRLYKVTLVKGKPEKYRAANRRKISG